MRACGLNSSGPEMDLVASCCEHGNGCKLVCDSLCTIVTVL